MRKRGKEKEVKRVRTEYERVKELYDKEYTIETIAKMLNMSRKDVRFQYLRCGEMNKRF